MTKAQVMNEKKREYIHSRLLVGLNLKEKEENVSKKNYCDVPVLLQ